MHDDNRGLTEARMLWVLLYRATHAIKRIRERELQDLGTTWIQTAVLHQIKMSEVPLTPTDIAKAVFRKTHTVSELIKRMEQQGLIQRTRDLKRKNVVRVQITKKGEDILEKSHELTRVYDIINSLSDGEKKSLSQIVQKILNESVTLLDRTYTSGYSNEPD